jgi:peptidoglycan/LPS O-acetylase OafA/YrhL
MWYVAIDFQLYALLALTVLALGRKAWLPCAALCAASLFWFNRQPQLDVWAIYFFGSYGLGAFVAWLPAGRRRWLWGGLGIGMVAAALALEWRTRVGVAAVTALLLAAPPRVPAPGWVIWLSRNSYAIFLIHYPVLVATGAVVYHLWPASALANGAGMTAAWLLSLGAGALLHRVTESTEK